MLIKHLRYKSILNAYRFWVFLLLTLIALPAFSQGSESISSQLGNLSASDVLANFAKQIPSLMRLITAVAYVLGMYFIFAGIVKMKHFGESRTMMSHEHSIIGPITFLAVGAALLYLPTSVQVGMSTFWNEPNPYGYLQQEPDQWTSFMNACFLIIQFIGTLALIRGLVILSHSGQSHGGQSNFAKALTHIIGGIFCINIYQFVQVVLVTIGIQT